MPESDPAQRHVAFTISYSNRVNALHYPVGVRIATTASNPALTLPDPSIRQVAALWDTGATGSVITAATARELGVVPISRMQVQHAGGISDQNVYLVDIILPNNIFCPAVRVTECADTAGHFGVIIGMDIIGMGDFAISNFEGKTTFSFRVPSKKKIDFVASAAPVAAPAKPKLMGYLPPKRGNGKGRR